MGKPACFPGSSLFEVVEGFPVVWSSGVDLTLGTAESEELISGTTLGFNVSAGQMSGVGSGAWRESSSGGEEADGDTSGGGPMSMGLKERAES